MKYGETLQQRSIPEWGYFNIDYDFLKDLIKHHTTPGAGTAVSIPGQGGTTQQEFRETLLRVLRSQHDRINLFIKSKSGEIERRLDHIKKRVLQLQARQPSEAADRRLRARTVERYAKIDADVSKAGEEIRCLARFQVAQRVGFQKILKKYKRWAKDSELEARFKKEVIDNPDSFFQRELGYLLDEYADVLQAVRMPFEQANTSMDSKLRSSGDPMDPISHIAKTIEGGSEVDFDSILSTLPLGPKGTKATYWIHPDHILEVEVLLLQHMRLYRSERTGEPRNDSLHATLTHQRSSSVTPGDEDSAGFVILDNPERQAQKQNTTTVAGIDEGRGAKASGYARWTSTDDSAIVAVGLDSDQDKQDSKDGEFVRLKRNQLPAFLDKSGYTTDESSQATSAKSVREWLLNHKEANPIVGICSKRTRFIGLQNNPAGGLWAILDQDIHMKGSMLHDLKYSDWVSKAHTKALKFPHTVLEIRKEGNQDATLIHLLDRSHLVERVRGFSVETHALWMCCKPAAMSAPYWMSTLEGDIRKLPEPVKKQRRRGTSNHGSFSSTPAHTTASTASATDGPSTPNTLRHQSSAGSGPDGLPVLTLKNFRKKSSRTRQLQHEVEEPIVQQRYWNEYDNPDSEDEGYYIYINPDEEVKFPGQEMIEKLAQKTKSLFRTSRGNEESPLLPHGSVGSVSSDDETPEEHANTLSGNYGTISDRHPLSTKKYFRNIFPFLGMRRDARGLDTLRRQSNREFMNEARIHERDMTKLKLYMTCIAAAVVIDVILAALAGTSRRKERGVVDVMVLFSTIFNMLLLIVAVLSLNTRRERVSWVHQGLVLASVLAVVIGDVLLLLWVWSP
ncbi:hypothetical protein GQ43DRAFT_434305 [Delitschia confertaspora ATCC 74209]|uniref:SPX domain-containing protein n=1 Tax=Delitschia confertaspora ATCC 74209 TaxID=1513339 RepID=A0A9P4MVW3_9PLEO|nr:hypothetical protein GQ43DRAFT_434305 [Delitschia confertaspora ATCC 74209]